MQARLKNVLVGALALVALSGLVGITYELGRASEQRHLSYRYQPASDPDFLMRPPKKVPLESYKPHCGNPQDNQDAYLCGQWASVEQATEANRISSLNLRFAIASLWAAVISAMLLVWTLIETRRTARHQLRPYIFFKVKVLEHLTQNGTIRAKVGFINTGPTPAMNLRVFTRFKVGAPNEPDSFFATVESKTGSNGFLGSGHDTLRERIFTVSSQHLADVRSGAKEIFLFGHASYSDVFGRKHMMTFRRRMYKKGGFANFYVAPVGESFT
jgi:hypothetical protein